MSNNVLTKRIPDEYKLVDADPLFESSKTLILRCSKKNTDDRTTYIVKISKKEAEIDGTLDPTERDFDISLFLMKSISSEHIVSVLESTIVGGSSVVVKEDTVGALDLKEHISLNGPMSVEQFFSIAIRLCAIFTQIHKARVLHLDIKVQYIFISDNVACKHSIQQKYKHTESI